MSSLGSIASRNPNLRLGWDAVMAEFPGLEVKEIASALGVNWWPIAGMSEFTPALVRDGRRWTLLFVPAGEIHAMDHTGDATFKTRQGRGSVA